jgi:ubiquinone/menaquinone biosynthesis C-methylase UbiE
MFEGTRMESRNYFDEVAPQWDKLRESFFSSAVRDKALSFANVHQGQIAADIGCGTGFVTEGLIQRGLRVIAVDSSEIMLSEMKRKFAFVDLIDYRLGDASSLPIQDETVDYVFANMYLHHVEVPQEAIKEMVRILKPGGMLVITDLDTHNFEFLKWEHNDRWMGFIRNDIRTWFEEAGLRNVVVDCIGENCCASSSCGSERAKIGIFVASGKK